MKLVDLTTKDFIKEMGSDSPAPGGGSASALCGAQAAALLAMVGRLTIGKKKYADVQELAEETVKEADRLEETLTEIIDRDTESFNAVSAVFAMPKDTDEEKAARKAAMQEALKLCTVTPLEMMRNGYEGLRLIEKAAGKLNLTAASDMGCAVLGFKSCIYGAWLNVLINIAGITDEAYAAKCREEGEKIMTEATALADQLYEKVKGLI